MTEDAIFEALARPLSQSGVDDQYPTSPSELPCVRQTVPFFDLPAEIRNRIYELAMPSKERGDEAVVVSSPIWDPHMVSAVQPGVTRASRQTREESSKMFYASNYFRIYVEHFDFRPLIHWARCMISSSLPSLRMHVFMLNMMCCYTGLLPFAQAWREIEEDGRLHLVVHSNFPDHYPGKRQCEALVRAIEAPDSAREHNCLCTYLLPARGFHCSTEKAVVY